jgi:hypothetical protein
MHSPCRYCEVYPHWQPPIGNSYCKKKKCRWYFKWRNLKVYANTIGNSQ